MKKWKPISAVEFSQLFEAQVAELSNRQKEIFARFSVTPWRATIRRSESAGDEFVYVVAEYDDEVLYFDDVEYGFNISQISKDGRILDPGGSQNTLSEAVSYYFPKS